jgi:PDZ domain
MNHQMLALSLLGCALCSTAQEPPASNKEPAADAKAWSSIQTRDGKIFLEADVNGRKESTVIDLTDPATAASMRGKVIITTDIDGKKEIRIVDAKDAEKLPAPFILREKPPVRTGPVTFLGVATVEVSRELGAQLPLPPETGLLICAVAPDSPAAAAGLQDNDVLGKLDDQILISPRQLAVLIANHKEGDDVKLTYFRKGQQMETNAKLGKREAPAVAESNDPLAPLASVTRRFWTLEGDVKPQESIRWQPGIKLLENKRTDDARHDVGGDLRRALQKCPAEVRSDIEKILREYDAVPAEKLPRTEPAAPASPPAEPNPK